jgi:hypothetical protein
MHPSPFHDCTAEKSKKEKPGSKNRRMGKMHDMFGKQNVMSPAGQVLSGCDSGDGLEIFHI